MIKYFIFLWIILIVNPANAQQTQDYKLKGHISGIDSGKVLMFDNDAVNVVDSAVIVNGNFEMHGFIALPEKRLFHIMPGTWVFQAFVENGVTELLIDTVGAKHYNRSDANGGWAFIEKMNQKGSSINDIYNQYAKETNRNELLNFIKSNPQIFDKALKNTSKNVELIKIFDSLTNKLSLDSKLWIDSYVEENPSSVAGVYLLYEYANQFNQFTAVQSLIYLQRMLSKFKGDAQNSIYFKSLVEKEKSLKNLQVESEAPNFTLLKRDKTNFTFSSLRGSYVLLDFWASWCVPCRKSIPHWKKIYSKYKNRGLQIVSISDDRNWEDWHKALDVEKMPWIQVKDNFPNRNETAEVHSLFGIPSLPFYILLNNQGRVVAAGNDKSVITKEIEQLIK